jgi:hypothetical protein
MAGNNFKTTVQICKTSQLIMNSYATHIVAHSCFLKRAFYLSVGGCNNVGLLGGNRHNINYIVGESLLRAFSHPSCTVIIVDESGAHFVMMAY